MPEQRPTNAWVTELATPATTWPASVLSRPCPPTLARWALDRHGFDHAHTLTDTDRLTVVEQAQAMACGLPRTHDWARAAQAHPETTGWQAWVTPCHWQMGNGQTYMGLPRDLSLSEDHSRRLLAAAQALFAEDGLTLSWHDPLHWHLSGPALSGWPAFSLARASGQDVQALMQTQPWPAPLGRLHMEMQMLFYTHPINDERAEQGLPPVNSLWVHGLGEPHLALPDRLPDVHRWEGTAEGLAATEAALQSAWAQAQAAQTPLWVHACLGSHRRCYGLDTQTQLSWWQRWRRLKVGQALQALGLWEVPWA